MDAMQLFIHIVKIHLHQHPIWFNSEIRHSIKCLRTLRCCYKCHPTQHTSNTIDSFEKVLQDKIAAAKQIFESDLINTYASTNNNKIFKYLKSFIKSNNIPSVINLGFLTARTVKKLLIQPVFSFSFVMIYPHSLI